MLRRAGSPAASHARRLPRPPARPRSPASCPPSPLTPRACPPPRWSSRS
jgi:hypothetical protein